MDTGDIEAAAREIEFDPDWVLKIFAPKTFDQEVFDERLEDPDAFLEMVSKVVDEMANDLEWLPQVPDEAARKFQQDSVGAILVELMQLMLVARSSYDAAITDDPRYAMVVAKLFFRLGYLFSLLETFAVQFHDGVRSDTLFGFATLGNKSILQRRDAARSRVEAERQQTAGTKAAALGHAIEQRRQRPNVSQEDLARELKAKFGSLVPKDGALTKWIQAWERAGDLAKPPRRSE